MEQLDRDHRLTAMVEWDLRQSVIDLAEEEDRTMSAMTRLLVLEGLEARTARVAAA